MHRAAIKLTGVILVIVLLTLLICKACKQRFLTYDQNNVAHLLKQVFLATRFAEHKIDRLAGYSLPFVISLPPKSVITDINLYYNDIFQRWSAVLVIDTELSFDEAIQWCKRSYGEYFKQFRFKCRDSRPRENRVIFYVDDRRQKHSVCILIREEENKTGLAINFTLPDPIVNELNKGSKTH